MSGSMGIMTPDVAHSQPQQPARSPADTDSLMMGASLQGEGEGANHHTISASGSHRAGITTTLRCAADHPVYTLAYYQKFFDVDSDEVASRLMKASEPAMSLAAAHAVCKLVLYCRL